MGIINDFIRDKNKRTRDFNKNEANNYWRTIQQKNRRIDKELSKRFDYERLSGETFTEYKKRMKQTNQI